jgi:hypothetical protein
MKLRWQGMLLTLAACASATLVSAGDITGKWKAEFDTAVGAQKYTFDLKVDGEKVTGKAHFERMGQTGDADLLEGKLSGDEVTFVEPMTMEGMPEMRIEYKGKVAGDEIAFTRTVGEFATETFTATRVKADAPPAP